MLARCGCFEKPKNFLEMTISGEGQVIYAAFTGSCFGISDGVFEAFQVFSRQLLLDSLCA